MKDYRVVWRDALFQVTAEHLNDPTRDFSRDWAMARTMAKPNRDSSVYGYSHYVEDVLSPKLRELDWNITHVVKLGRVSRTALSAWIIEMLLVLWYSTWALAKPGCSGLGGNGLFALLLVFLNICIPCMAVVVYALAFVWRFLRGEPKAGWEMATEGVVCWYRIAPTLTLLCIVLCGALLYTGVFRYSYSYSDGYNGTSQYHVTTIRDRLTGTSWTASFTDSQCVNEQEQSDENQ